MTTEGKTKIGKQDIAPVIARRAGLTVKHGAEAFDAITQVIVQALLEGRSVGLPGLGTLSVKPTASRRGVRPSSGETIIIPAGRKVSFKVSTGLKDELRGETTR